jgi:phosphate-selective porin OprO/OprP
VRIAGARGLAALAYTGRTVNDAEVFDSQQALVGRLGGLVASSTDYNLHLGINGTYVLRPAQSSLADGTNQSGIRFRDRPEMRVDSTRLIDTGGIDADSAYSTGVELAANWKNLLLQGEHFWYGIERRNSTFDDPSFGGGYLEASWLLTGESRRYSTANAVFQAPTAVPSGPRGWKPGAGIALQRISTSTKASPGRRPPSAAFAAASSRYSEPV